MTPAMFLLALVALAVLLLVMWLAKRIVYGPSGADASRYYNRRVGRWRVRYSDGQYSEPMCYDVAQDYAEIFGGVVVPKSEYPAAPRAGELS